MRTILRISSIVFVYLLISNSKLIGQIAENILIDKSDLTRSSFVCTGTQFAGNFHLGAINAQSNDVTANRKFLCRGDQFNVIHNGNAMFEGDPDPLTAPGIGYAWYKCAPNPALSGPADLSVITSDPCVFDLVNAPTLGIFIYADQQNGNALFRNVPYQQANGNVESIPEYYNAGSPIEIWFAPITYDRLDNGQAAYEGGSPCVDVNTNAAFSIVYLNPVDATNITKNVGGNPRSASFIPTGGVSEFDGSAYSSVSIYKSSNPSIVASNISGTLSHGNTVTFTVPEQGMYTIEITDNKGCPFQTTIFMGADPLEVGIAGCDTLQFENLEPGDNICLPVIVNNWDSITVISFGIVWDASVLRFNTVQNIGSIGIDAFSFGTSFPNGVTLVAFNFPLASGETLPDGSTIFEICFDIIGLPFSSTSVLISDFQNTDIEASNVASGGGDIPVVLLTPCEITVSPTTNLTGFLSTCGGSPEGDINMTVIGGTEPYEYDYVNTSDGTIFMNNVGFLGMQTDFSVPPGNYDVTIRDALGVEVVYNVTVDPTLVAISGTNLTTFTNPTCYNFTNGQIRVVAEGGTPPYSYEIQDLNAPGLPHYSGYILSDGGSALVPSLPASNYFLIVQDANGCEAALNIMLDANPFIIDELSKTDATCNGTANGAITLDVSGSRPFQPSMEYNFDFPAKGVFGAPTMSGGMVSLGALDPGEYEITFYSSVAGCDTTYIFTIGSITTTSANIVPTPESCIGVSDGRVTITGTTDGVIGGNYNYSIFTLSNAAVVLNQNEGATLNYDPLAPGDYKVVVENVANGCLSDTLFFTINEGTSIVASLDTTTLDDCSPIATGTATFNIAGGVMPYTLDLGGVGIQNGNTISQLNSGSYIMTITDDNSCSTTVPFNIQNYEDVGSDLIHFEVNGTPCAGGTISAIYNGVVANPPQVGVDWSVDGTSIPGNSGTIDIDQEGNYSVFIIDVSIHCQLNSDTSIICDDFLNLDITVFQPECHSSALPGGSTTGSVLVDTSNAVAPVTYYWSIPDTTINNGFKDNLAPGWYYVTVTDAIDSTVVDSFEILAPAPINFVFGGIDETSCVDACNGEVDVTPANTDNPIDPFQLYWDANGTATADTGFVITADGLCGGFQSFIVSQDGLCFYQDSVFIPSPDSIKVELISLQNISCFGAMDGSIEVNAMGGNGPYDYLWETLDISTTINSLGPDTFNVRVTDANLCTAIDSFIIMEPDSLVLTIDSLSSTSIGCDGQGGGVFTAVTGGNNSSFTYNWNPSVTTESFAINLVSGNYQITVTDGNGCTDITSYEMTAPIPLSFMVNTISAPQCAGDDAIITVDTVFGGSGSGYTFSVQNGPNQNLGTPIPVSTGQYVLSVSDSTGCTVDTMFTIFEPNPIVIIITPDSTLVDLGASANLQGAVVDSDNPIISFQWSPNQLVDCDTCLNINTLNTADQIFTLIATDTAGCVGEAQAVVFINSNRRVFIPNVFSPNNDGRNEIFRVFTGAGVSMINSFEVFDRWGEKVYSDQDVVPENTGSVGWNGEMNQTPMEPGVYVYLINITFLDGQTLTYRGDVTLLR